MVVKKSDEDLGSDVKNATNDYDLHKECALTTNFKSDISLYNSYVFKFHPRTFVGTTCNACGNAILGFVYIFPTKRLNLHPCCANFPGTLESGAVKLFLDKQVSSRCFRCCKPSSQGWSYQSTCKNYHIHVSCMKDLVKKEVEEKWNSYFCGSESSSVNVCQVLKSESESKGWWKSRSWRVAAVILNLVISIVLGNPFGAIGLFVAFLPEGAHLSMVM